MRPASFIFLFIFIFRQLASRDASPCMCLPHSFIQSDCCPPFSPPSFLFRYVAHSLSLSSYLDCLHCLYGCLSYPTRIIYGCPLFISLLFVFCFLVFPSESFSGDDVLWRLL